VSDGDSRVCAVVRNLLDAADGVKLMQVRDVQNGTRFVVGEGALRAGIVVYSTGTIVVDGPDSPLKEKCLALRRRAEESALVLDAQSRSMPVCPMNRERCSCRNRIDSLYSPNRVFIDVPYDPVYAEYERAIIETLKRRRLVPILAKDRASSDILLCKVCRLIQTCQYGVADISLPSLNVPYELGLMHALGMNCAILKSESASQPADIQGKEHISYHTLEGLASGLDKWLADNAVPAATA